MHCNEILMFFFSVICIILDRIEQKHLIYIDKYFYSGKKLIRYKSETNE
jgi:hypothetical protein